MAVGEDPASPNPSSYSPYSTLAAEPRKPDPYFNAPFFNDKTYEERPFLKSVFSFIKKHHAEGVANSFAQRLMDQLEFGGCLADYPGMHARYKKLRALEDVDEIRMLAEGHPQGAYAQVRFVNYYTLSSGIPKKPKTPEEGSEDESDTDRLEPGDIKGIETLDVDPLNEHSTDGGVATPGSSISVKVEDYSTTSQKGPQGAFNDTKLSPREKKPSDVDMSRLSMQDIDPTPMSDSDDPVETPQIKEDLVPDNPAEVMSVQRTATEDLDLPPLAEEPTPPVLPDLDQYTDKSARKQAEKESKRLQKAYEHALKDRAKSIREREKLLEKRRKDTQKALDKQDRQAQKQVGKHEQKEKQRLQKEEQRLEKERLRMEKESQKLLKKQDVAGESSKPASQRAKESFDIDELSDEEELPVADEPGVAADAAPKKRKKFCTLPRKVNGQFDDTWVDIYMENMNEVTAHCGLFFAGPHYDKLVGDVGSRIVGWVQDDLTKRAILDMPVD